MPLVGSAYLEVDATRPVGEVPFVGVRVSFFDGDVEMSPPLAFTGTRFTIAGLPPGTYRAVLTHDLLPKPIVRERVELVAGETGAVELR